MSPGSGGELLLSLLRGEPAPGDGHPRWPEALALAGPHGVGPLLHATAQRLPAGAAGALRKQRAASLRDSLWREAGLRRALLSLPDAVVLKGAAYAAELYEAPELRPSADIDLLHPHAESMPGYQWHPATRVHEGRAHWHERTFVDPCDGRVVIDLHRAFTQRERSSVDVAALFSRAGPRCGLRLLHRDDAVLIHAHNLANHELRVPLILVADFARLWARCAHEAVVERALEFRLCGALFAALELLAACAGEAGRFGGVAVEPRELELELSALSRRGLRWAVSRYDLSRSRLGRLEQLARKALFIDRPRDLLRFGWAEARRRLS